MNAMMSLVPVYLMIAYVPPLQSLTCFDCKFHEKKCRDDLFQDYEQEIVDCTNGTCMKVRDTNFAGPIDRYCLPGFQWYGCDTSTVDLVVCGCYYKDNCNGPVGVVGAGDDGLQCYDCYLNAECSDNVFNQNYQVLVNCGNGSCFKTIYKSVDSVHRGCSAERITTGCIDTVIDGQSVLQCACHDQNGCNEATTIRQTTISYIYVLIIYYLHD